MKAQRVVLACLVPLAMSCGGPEPSAPTEIPEMRGTWGGTAVAWRWTDGTYSDSGYATRSAMCEGTIDVGQQDGGTFTGRYRIGCVSSTGNKSSSGVVFDGRVSPDNKVSFRLRATEGFDPSLIPGWLNPPCPLIYDPGVYDGKIANGSMSVSRAQQFECAPGQIAVFAAFQGPRQ